MGKQIILDPDGSGKIGKYSGVKGNVLITSVNKDNVKI